MTRPNLSEYNGVSQGDTPLPPPGGGGGGGKPRTTQANYHPTFEVVQATLHMSNPQGLDVNIDWMQKEDEVTVLDFVSQQIFTRVGTQEVFQFGWKCDFKERWVTDFVDTPDGIHEIINGLKDPPPFFPTTCLPSSTPPYEFTPHNCTGRMVSMMLGVAYLGC